MQYLPQATTKAQTGHEVILSPLDFGRLIKARVFWSNLVSTENNMAGCGDLNEALVVTAGKLERTVEAGRYCKTLNTTTSNLRSD